MGEGRESIHFVHHIKLSTDLREKKKHIVARERKTNIVK